MCTLCQLSKLQTVHTKMINSSSLHTFPCILQNPPNWKWYGLISKCVHWASCQSSKLQNVYTEPVSKLQNVYTLSQLSKLQNVHTEPVVQLKCVHSVRYLFYSLELSSFVTQSLIYSVLLPGTPNIYIYGWWCGFRYANQPNFLMAPRSFTWTVYWAGYM